MRKILMLCALTAVVVIPLGVPATTLATEPTLVTVHTPYEHAVLHDFPLLYYRLGDAPGSTTVIDSSGNHHDGVADSGVAFGQPGALPGDPDTSALFDGSTAVVNSGIQVFSPSSTIEAWISPTSSTCVGSGCSDNQAAIAGTGGSFQLTYGRDPQHVRVWLWPQDNSGWYTLDAPTAIPIDTGTTRTWTYLAATWDGSDNLLSIYVNGKLDNSVELPGVSSSTQPGTNYNFTVGGFSPGEQPFPGGIDEVAYYNSALTPSRILAHYRAAATLIIPSTGKVTHRFLSPSSADTWTGPYYDWNDVLRSGAHETAHPGVDISGQHHGLKDLPVCVML